MKFVDKLERKFGKYAIKNLMYYIIGLYVLGFAIDMFFPEIYYNYLSLDVEKILSGQIWRVVTFIIQPPNSSIIFMVFAMYFYYMIGTILERIWGAFKFNLYYFSGLIFHVLAAFILYFVFGVNPGTFMSTYYINLALFMAFAVEQPDLEVLLFFILPIKIKWLAILDGVLFGITIIGGYLTPFMPKFIWRGLYNAGLLSGSVYSCYVIATCALVSMLNFLIFAFLYAKGPAKTKTQKDYNKAMKTAKKAQNEREKQARQAQQNSGANRHNETNDKKAKKQVIISRHRCAVCGRTEIDNPNLIFRYCSKCDGGREYCQEHLYTHIHVNKN